jgi:hypothetical protein
MTDRGTKSSAAYSLSQGMFCHLRVKSALTVVEQFLHSDPCVECLIHMCFLAGGCGVTGVLPSCGFCAAGSFPGVWCLCNLQRGGLWPPWVWLNCTLSLSTSVRWTCAALYRSCYVMGVSGCRGLAACALILSLRGQVKEFWLATYSHLPVPPWGCLVAHLTHQRRHYILYT